MPNRYRAANPSRGLVGPLPERDPSLDLSYMPVYRGCLGEPKLLHRVVDYIDPKTGKAVLNALSTAPYFRPEMINARSDRVRPSASTWRPARTAAPAVDRIPLGEPAPPAHDGFGFVHRAQAAREADRLADLERRFEALRQLQAGS